MSNFSSRVAIVEINAPLRTDESFQNCIREYHHNGNSIFELLDFSVDPLNLVVVVLHVAIIIHSLIDSCVNQNEYARNLMHLFVSKWKILMVHTSNVN